MSMSPHLPLSSDLPDVLPIFPLSGALLLPHGHLPLYIFEPRYLSMVTDALGRDRMIGMIQPIIPEPGRVGDSVKLHGVGCAGRIVSFSETDDGHFEIVLLGISRFQVAEELDLLNGYRRIVPDFEAFRSDQDEDGGMVADRNRLLKAVRAFCEAKQIEVDWEAIEEASDEALVSSLSMICPFDPQEKQALLECNNLGARSDMLTSLMEMALLESGDDTVTAARH